MSFKILHRPQPFSDDLDQDVESFFDNYELAAIINEWGDREKIILLPIYLKSTAENFFKIIKTKNPKITWHDAKKQIKEKFTTIGNKILLLAQLKQKKLKEGEKLSKFVIDISELCNRIDVGMKEEDI
jgi:hypothetical protein